MEGGSSRAVLFSAECFIRTITERIIAEISPTLQRGLKNSRAKKKKKLSVTMTGSRWEIVP